MRNFAPTYAGSIQRGPKRESYKGSRQPKKLLRELFDVLTLCSCWPPPLPGERQSINTHLNSNDVEFCDILPSGPKKNLKIIVISKLKCPVLLASEMSGFGFLGFIYLSSSSGCGNVGKSGRFGARLSQAAAGSECFYRFPWWRHFHRSAISLVATHTVWAEGDGDTGDHPRDGVR